MKLIIVFILKMESEETRIPPIHNATKHEHYFFRKRSPLRSLLIKEGYVAARSNQDVVFCDVLLSIIRIITARCLFNASNPHIIYRKSVLKGILSYETIHYTDLSFEIRRHLKFSHLSQTSTPCVIYPFWCTGRTMIEKAISRPFLYRDVSQKEFPNTLLVLQMGSDPKKKLCSFLEIHSLVLRFIQANERTLIRDSATILYIKGTVLEQFFGTETISLCQIEKLVYDYCRITLNFHERYCQ